MAELPRYRPLGAAISSMPSVNFVETGRAQAQVYNKISDALNKVSEFAFEKAVAEAEREGLKYGYNNPLTEDQINMALKGELNLDDVVQDPGTIFGAASRAGTATQLRVKLEAAARNNLSAINAAIEGGQDYNVNQIAADIEAMTDGYGGLIAQLDTEQAASYSATINTLASSTYKLALETAYKKEQTAKMVGASLAMQQVDSQYRALYKASAGEMVTYNDQVMLDADVSALTLDRSMRDLITDTNNLAFIETNYANLETIKLTAKTDVITEFVLSDEFSTNEADFYGKVRNNDFGRYTALYNTLDPKEQSKLKVALRTEIKTKIEEEKTLKTIKVEDFKSETAKLIADLADIPVGSLEEKETFARLNAIFALSDGEAGLSIDSPSYDSLNENRRNPFKETKARNYPAEYQLRQMILEGKITTLSDLSAEGERLGIDAEQLLPMQTTLGETNRRTEADLDKLAKRLAGIVPDTVPDAIAKANYFRVLDRIDEQHAEDMQNWIDGGQVGNPPTRLSSGQKLIIDIANSPAQENITMRLNNLNAKYGEESGSGLNIVFDVYTNYDDIEDVLNKAGLSKTEKADIKSALIQIQKLHSGLLD